MNVLAISHPILIRFECSWALFKAGGYRNAYPYPSLPVVLTHEGLKTRGVHYLLVTGNMCMNTASGTDNGLSFCATQATNGLFNVRIAFELGTEFGRDIMLSFRARQVLRSSLSFDFEEKVKLVFCGWTRALRGGKFEMFRVGG